MKTRLARARFALCSLMLVALIPSCKPEPLAKARKVLEASAIPSAARTAILARMEASNFRFLSLLAEVEKTRATDQRILERVDKKRALPKDYVPADLEPLDGRGISVSRPGHELRRPAVEALLAMIKAARKDGVDLMVSSAYRSYEYQTGVFARNVKEVGEREARRLTAEAGMSQHQLGTAVDFGSIDDSFADTKAGRWLSANARRFGFSLSYPRGMEAVTGYAWESWHYRFVGKDAAALQEEYFGGIQQYLILFLDGYR
jgi:D-alanyl-D-alanine carboxypeptidase